MTRRCFTFKKCLFSVLKLNAPHPRPFHGARTFIVKAHWSISTVDQAHASSNPNPLSIHWEWWTVHHGFRIVTISRRYKQLFCAFRWWVPALQLTQGRRGIADDIGGNVDVIIEMYNISVALASAVFPNISGHYACGVSGHLLAS